MSLLAVIHNYLGNTADHLIVSPPRRLYATGTVIAGAAGTFLLTQDLSLVDTLTIGDGFWFEHLAGNVTMNASSGNIVATEFGLVTQPGVGGGNLISVLGNFVLTTVATNFLGPNAFTVNFERPFFSYFDMIGFSAAVGVTPTQPLALRASLLDTVSAASTLTLRLFLQYRLVQGSTDG